MNRNLDLLLLPPDPVIQYLLLEISTEAVILINETCSGFAFNFWNLSFWYFSKMFDNLRIEHKHVEFTGMSIQMLFGKS